MRYCFLILSFFIAAASLSAQSDITNKILSDIYKKAGLKDKIKHNFLSKENKSAAKAAEHVYVPEVILAYAETDSGLTVTRDSVIYDEAGLPLLAINQVNAGSGWINVQKDSAVYLEGKDIFTERSLWENNKWAFKHRSNKTYNGLGLVELFIGETVNLVDTLKYEIRYVYDENKRVSVITYYSIEASQAVPQFRYSFDYNAAGDISEMLREVSAEGGWINFTLETHKFNENGFETLGLYQVWGNNQWDTYERNIYTLDQAGHVTSQVVQLRPAGVLENSDSLSFTYDEKGNMMTEILSYWEDGSWVLMDSLKFGYDASDRVIMQEWHMRAVTEWLKWSRKSYAYDLNNNLILTSTEQGTAGNTWENLDKLEYLYDIVGNLVKGEYFVWTESAWANANGVINMGYDYYNAYLADARFIRVGTVAVEDDNINPNMFALGQNYPNPFNPETKISFSLPESGKATLKIYDALGREVMELVNGAMEKGAHTVNFSGRNLSSGVYIYRLQSGNFTESKKMMLLK